MDPALRVQVAQRERDAPAVEARVRLGLLRRRVEQHPQVAAATELEQKIARLVVLEGVEEPHDRRVVEAGVHLLLLEQVVDALLLLRGRPFTALLEGKFCRAAGAAVDPPNARKLARAEQTNHAELLRGRWLHQRGLG